MAGHPHGYDCGCRQEATRPRPTPLHSAHPSPCAPRPRTPGSEPNPPRAEGPLKTDFSICTIRRVRAQPDPITYPSHHTRQVRQQGVVLGVEGQAAALRAAEPAHSGGALHRRHHRRRHAWAVGAAPADQPARLRLASAARHTRPDARTAAGALPSILPSIHPCMHARTLQRNARGAPLYAALTHCACAVWALLLPPLHRSSSFSSAGTVRATCTCSSSIRTRSSKTCCSPSSRSISASRARATATARPSSAAPSRATGESGRPAGRSGHPGCHGPPQKPRAHKRPGARDAAPQDT